MKINFYFNSKKNFLFYIFFLFIFLFLIVFSINMVNSATIGDNEARGVNIEIPISSAEINYSLVNVNNSQYLNTHPDTYFYPYSNPLGFLNNTYNSTYDAKVSMSYTNLALTNKSNTFTGLQTFNNNISENGRNLYSKYLGFAPTYSVDPTDTTGYLAIRSAFVTIGGTLPMLHMKEFNDILAGCANRFDTSFSGVNLSLYSPTASKLCDNNFEDLFIIHNNTIASFYFNLTAKEEYSSGDGGGIIYSRGSIYISFYGNYAVRLNQINVSFYAGNSASTATWTSTTCYKNIIDSTTNYFTYRCPVTPANYLRAINITISNENHSLGNWGGGRAALSEISYFLDRFDSAHDQTPTLTKYENNKLYTLLNFYNSTNGKTITLDPNGTIISDIIVGDGSKLINVPTYNASYYLNSNPNLFVNTTSGIQTLGFYNTSQGNRDLLITDIMFDSSRDHKTDHVDGTNILTGAGVKEAFWNITGGHNGKGAYSFNGTMKLSGNIAKGQTFYSITYSLWVYPLKSPGSYMLAYAQGSDFIKGFSLKFNNDNSIDCNFNINGTDGGAKTYKLSSGWSIGKWIHIVCMFNSSDIIMFKNGTRIGNSNIGTTNITANSLTFTIGNDNYYGVGWNGTLDDFKVWNRTLTDDEVLAEYNYKSLEQLNQNQFDWINSTGNINTLSNFTVNNLQGLTRNFNMTNGSSKSCWMNFTGGILTYSNC